MKYHRNSRLLLVIRYANCSLSLTLVGLNSFNLSRTTLSVKSNKSSSFIVFCFFNCPLCLNFPFLLLSFACGAFLCSSFITLPPDKRKCVKTSYFAFCFFCASYSARVIHLGLLSILFRSSLLHSLSILSSITERYLRNSQKLVIICIGSTAP